MAMLLRQRFSVLLATHHYQNRSGVRGQCRGAAGHHPVLVRLSNGLFFLPRTPQGHLSSAMVRSYERHEPTAAYALVCSNAANALLDEDGKTAFLPALEDVLVWDMKRGEQVRGRLTDVSVACGIRSATVRASRL